MGMAGIMILAGLVLTSAVTVIAIPLETFQEWSNPNSWLHYPKAAVPGWVNAFSPEAVPEHMIMDDSLSYVDDSGMVTLHSDIFAIDYAYDDFPGGFIYEYSARYEGAPLLVVEVLRPDGMRMSILSVPLPPADSATVHNEKIFSTDLLISKNLMLHSDEFDYDIRGRAAESIIFADTAEPAPPQGKVRRYSEPVRKRAGGHPGLDTGGGRQGLWGDGDRRAAAGPGGGPAVGHPAGPLYRSGGRHRIGGHRPRIRRVRRIPGKDDRRIHDALQRYSVRAARPAVFDHTGGDHKQQHICHDRLSDDIRLGGNSKGVQEHGAPDKDAGVRRGGPDDGAGQRHHHIPAYDTAASAICVCQHRNISARRHNDRGGPELSGPGGSVVSYLGPHTVRCQHVRGPPRADCGGGSCRPA